MKRLSLLLPVLLTPSMLYAMDISSTSISDGIINTDSACADHDGDDASPQLTISGAPDTTTHFAVIMDDPDARKLDGKTWVHWNVVNIPAESTSLILNEDNTPPGEELANDNEDEEYGGMCPEDGRHIYRIGVFALSSIVDTEDAAAMNLEMFKSRFGSQILDQAVLKGAFP